MPDHGPTYQIDQDTAREVIGLWPDGPPRTIEGVPPESTFAGPPGAAVDTVMLRNISEPTLTVFKPAPGKANGVGVVVCPGGGWRILAWQHEGLDTAQWLADRGYTAFLLKYRVMATPADMGEFMTSMAAMNARVAEQLPADGLPRSFKPFFARDERMSLAREIAAEDGRRAVAIVRERAAEWGISPDRVGMIGFSAGAFLVADIAVDPKGPPLNFAAPIYGGETNGVPVPADGPPLFMVVTQDDRMLFKVVESLYADWSNADRSVELHVFARGGHGFGMVQLGLPVDRWLDLLSDWLKDKGFS